MQKITCIHFFVDVGFATVQGLGVVAPFSVRKKVPEIPWDMLQDTSLRSVKAVGLSPRPTGLVCGHLFPYLHCGLNFPFAHRFEC
jgi:hypothetical protein